MDKQKPNFEQAMNVALLWCNAWEEGSLSEEVLADRVAELVATKAGARGFFAISLSSDCPLMDRLPEPIVIQLRQAGKIVVELTTKNLAMSTAMTIIHKRNNDRECLSGAERVTRRCTELLRLLDPHLVKTSLESLLAGSNGEGDEVTFFTRWQYDREQKTAIAKSINAVAEN